MSASVQSGARSLVNLVATLEVVMMFVSARCNNAGPLGKPIPTRSFAVRLLARLHGRALRLRW
jgi:hypothetical protein